MFRLPDAPSSLNQTARTSPSNLSTAHNSRITRFARIHMCTVDEAVNNTTHSHVRAHTRAKVFKEQCSASVTATDMRACTLLANTAREKPGPCESPEREFARAVELCQMFVCLIVQFNIAQQRAIQQLRRRPRMRNT